MIGIFDERFLSANPIWLTLCLEDRLSYVLWLLISFSIFVCEFTEVQVPFTILIKVIRKIFDFPILKDTKIIKFLLELISWNIAVMIFIKLFEESFHLSIIFFSFYLWETCESNSLVMKTWLSRRWWKGSYSSIKSLLGLLICLFYEFCELLTWYFILCVEIKIRSKAVIFLFIEIESFILHKQLHLLPQLITRKSFLSTE